MTTLLVVEASSRSPQQAMAGPLFATTTTVHALTCGEMLSDEVILEGRNGPRRLSDNDDDDDD